MLAVLTTCKNNNNNKNIDNNHYCTKKMWGKVWGVKHHLKNKNTCIEKNEFYKKGCFSFLLLQKESCVCIWDLKQGTRLQNHPGRKVVWDCVEAGRKNPRSKDRGVSEGWRKETTWKSKDDSDPCAWNTSTRSQLSYTNRSPYNIKSCFIVNVVKWHNKETTWSYCWTL